MHPANKKIATIKIICFILICFVFAKLMIFSYIQKI